MQGTRWLFGLTTAALLVVVALPLLFVGLQAVFPAFGQGSFAGPFSRFADVLGDAALIGLTANTLGVGLGVVLGSALLGVPLALFRVPLGPVWDVLLLVPFMIPPYIAALGWIMTLQPAGYLQQLAGVNMGAFLFSPAGVVFVMVLNVFPVVYFAVSRTVAAVGARFADVSRVCGATPRVAFLRVTLPLATPGLAASLLLVFVMAIEEYGTPAALASRSGFDVLVTGIETRVSDWPIDLSGAAILSLILVVLSLLAFVAQLRIVSRRNYETVGGKPPTVERRPLGLLGFPVALLFLGSGSVILSMLAVTMATYLGTGMVARSMLPLFAIVATALSRTISGGLAASNLGWQNFAQIAGDESGALQALGNSLALGVATALITGLIGAMAGYGVVRTRIRGRHLLDALSNPGHRRRGRADPGVEPAVLAGDALQHAADPAARLLLPFPVRYANAAFRQIGDSLEAAARVAGASAFTAFRRILLPLVFPSMLAAMLLVFAIASRELVASIMVTPTGFQTIATFIWRQFDQGSVGLGMAMSAIAILITTTIPLAVTLAMRNRAGWS